MSIPNWKSLNEGLSIPDAKDVAREFVRLCGGPTDFAKYLFDQAMMPTTSAHTKMKIFNMILGFMKPEDGDQADDLGMLSEDDLDQSLKSMMNSPASKDARDLNY